MKIKGKLLSSRQLAFIIFIIASTYKLINLSRTLIGVSGRDAWIAISLHLVLEWIYLGVFFLLVKLSKGRCIENILDDGFRVVAKLFSRNSSKGVVNQSGQAQKTKSQQSQTEQNQVLQPQRTCIATRIVMLFFGGFILLSLMLQMTVVEQFLHTTLFAAMDYVTFALPLTLLLIYSSIKGLRSIGRTCEFLGWVGIIALVVCIVAACFKANFSLVLPICYRGIGDCFKAFESTLTIGGKLIILPLFLGRVETKNLKRNCTVAMCFSTLMCLLFVICFIGIYGEAGRYMRHGQAIIDMLQTLKGSDSITRIDVFVIIAIMIMLILTMLVMSWSAVKSIMIATTPGLGYVAKDIVKGGQQSSAKNATQDRLYRHGKMYVSLIVLLGLAIIRLFITRYDMDLFVFVFSPMKYIFVIPCFVVFQIILIICSCTKKIT